MPLSESVRGVTDRGFKLPQVHMESIFFNESSQWEARSLKLSAQVWEDPQNPHHSRCRGAQKQGPLCLTR